MEIECVGLGISGAISALVAAGIPVATGSYDSEGKWSVKDDCSLSDNEFGTEGCEVVSPILTGRAGLAQVQKVAKALRANGARANRSCGLHVHVGAKGMTPRHVQGILSRYAAFEHEIEAFMPESRRNNHFAKPVTLLISNTRSLMEPSAESVSLMARSISCRYYRVNVASFVRHGTIEFRHHSGSVDAEVISNWVLFVLNFVEASTPAKAPRAPKAPKARNGVRANARSKGLAKILSCILTGTGSSTEELSAVSGYSVSSIPSVISEIRRVTGVRIRSRKSLGYDVLATHRWTLHPLASRERARRALYDLQLASGETTIQARQSTPSPVSVLPVYPNDSVFRGLPLETVAFYLERRSEFGGGR